MIDAAARQIIAQGTCSDEDDNICVVSDYPNYGYCASGVRREGDYSDVCCASNCIAADGSGRKICSGQSCANAEGGSNSCCFSKISAKPGSICTDEQDTVCMILHTRRQIEI